MYTDTHGQHAAIGLPFGMKLSCLEVTFSWETVAITYTPQSKSEGKDATYKNSSGLP